MLTPAQRRRMLKGMKPLDEELREWRESLGLTQSEAARRCGMSAQHWWLLEKGERFDLRGDTFRKISEATGKPLERLIIAADLLREKREIEADRDTPLVGASAHR